LSKRWELRLLAYVNSPDVEESEKGVRDGLKKSGLVEGRDYVLKSANAQGDMSALNGLVDAALGDHADLLLTISSSALQSCVQRAKGTPIVFTMVANPFIAGVGKSDNDHLKNVTGAYGSNDVTRMMPIIKQLMPNAKRVGALYAPNEVNSVYSYELVEQGVKASGYELLSAGINSASEAPDATQSLCDKNLDLFCLPNSNLASSSYPTIAQTATRAKIPIFGFMGSMASKGAVVALTRDYYDMGVDSGQIAARVIRGELPESIPFYQCKVSRLYVNPAAAAANGVHLPPEFVKSADHVIGQ
jgi:putative ABC transport system substrate-binding protein